MNLEDNEQSEVDLAAAVEEISADLFGESSDENPQPAAEPSSEGEGRPLVSSGDEKADLPPTENTQEVQELGAPKTWTKEALQEWASLPAGAKTEILKREEDYLRGITGYKARAEVGDSYSKVVEPYQAILAAEGVDPVQLFQSFSANHYLLSRGTMDQKLEIAQSLIQGYGIDFDALVSKIGNTVYSPADPRVAALERQIQELQSSPNATRQQETSLLHARLDQEIKAFADDPANVHFPKLVDDISALMGNGQASSLREAYDKAVLLNPETREAELERLTAEKLSNSQTLNSQKEAAIARSTAADLRLLPKSRSGTIATGTMEETLQETLAALRANE